MERTVRVKIVVEADITIDEDVTLGIAVKRFQPNDAWYSGDIWVENFSIQDWEEIEQE